METYGTCTSPPSRPRTAATAKLSTIVQPRVVSRFGGVDSRSTSAGGAGVDVSLTTHEGTSCSHEANHRAAPWPSLRVPWTHDRVSVWLRTAEPGRPRPGWQEGPFRAGWPGESGRGVQPARPDAQPARPDAQPGWDLVRPGELRPRQADRDAEARKGPSCHP